MQSTIDLEFTSAEPEYCGTWSQVAIKSSVGEKLLSSLVFRAEFRCIYMEKLQLL